MTCGANFQANNTSRRFAGLLAHTELLKATWTLSATTSGYHVGGRADYAMFRKEYGNEKECRCRYAPPKLVASEKAMVYDNPGQERTCTSQVKRWNLSLGLGMKRMSWLTVALSRWWRNHKAALAL